MLGVHFLGQILFVQMLEDTFNINPFGNLTKTYFFIAQVINQMLFVKKL
jgi:hypothetical protein